VISPLRAGHRRIAISLVAGTLNSAAAFSIAVASSGARWVRLDAAALTATPLLDHVHIDNNLADGRVTSAGKQSFVLSRTCRPGNTISESDGRTRDKSQFSNLST
jgi:hypothetical protein